MNRLRASQKQSNVEELRSVLFVKCYDDKIHDETECCRIVVRIDFFFFPFSTINLPTENGKIHNQVKNLGFVSSSFPFILNSRIRPIVVLKLDRNSCSDRCERKSDSFYRRRMKRKSSRRTTAKQKKSSS